MTKFFMAFVISAALCGSALAQDDVSLPDPNAGGDQGGSTEAAFDREATYQACLSEHASDPDFTGCCTDYADCEEQRTDSERLLTDVAANRGQTPAEMAEQDCRSRRGELHDSQCTCNEPNQWFGTAEEPKQCCTPNVRRYENRMHACQDSGGSWTCRGECHCPNAGQQLMNGVCEGDATTREEVDRMRTRLPELESELARLQAERNALQANLDQAQADLARVGELEGQLAEVVASVEEMEQGLVEMDAELSFLRHLREQYEAHIARQALMIGELGGIPPAVPSPSSPDPFLGTAEAVAEAASGTESNPLAPTPPPIEENETIWCNRGFGEVLLCYVLPAVATAGLGVGIWAATRDIEIQQ